MLWVAFNDAGRCSAAHRQQLFVNPASPAGRALSDICDDVHHLSAYVDTKVVLSPT